MKTVKMLEREIPNVEVEVYLAEDYAVISLGNAYYCDNKLTSFDASVAAGLQAYTLIALETIAANLNEDCGYIVHPVDESKIYWEKTEDEY